MRVRPLLLAIYLLVPGILFLSLIWAVSTFFHEPGRWWVCGCYAVALLLLLCHLAVRYFPFNSSPED